MARRSARHAHLGNLPPVATRLNALMQEVERLGKRRGAAREDGATRRVQQQRVRKRYGDGVEDDRGDRQPLDWVVLRRVETVNGVAAAEGTRTLVTRVLVERPGFEAQRRYSAMR